MVGFLGFTVLGLILLLLAFKFVPVFVEHNAIERHFRSMAQDPSLRQASRRELDRAWTLRSTADDVRSIKPEDIEYAREADRLVVSGEYSVRVPLFANVSACLDFKPSSE